MARHWSAYTPNVSPKQAYALDRIAEANGHASGLALLMSLAGCSSSKTQKMMGDYPTARRLLDEAFALRSAE